jgi:hypothetical protein
MQWAARVEMSMGMFTLDETTAVSTHWAPITQSCGTSRGEKNPDCTAAKAYNLCMIKTQNINKAIYIYIKYRKTNSYKKIKEYTGVPPYP